MADEKTRLVGTASKQEGSSTTSIAPKQDSINFLERIKEETSSEESKNERKSLVSPYTRRYDEISLVSTHPESISREGSIRCQVCNETIDVTGKYHQHVVKCQSCQECIPIKPPPLGQKYIRCKAPCNCLLICSNRCLQTICPRPYCKTIINLAPPRRPNLIPQSVPGVCRVSCGYCFDGFLFNIEASSYAKCPHCSKLSSIGDQYKKRKYLKFIFLGIIVLILGVSVLAGTVNGVNTKIGYLVAYIVIFAIATGLLCRGIYYVRMKVSHADLLA